MLPDMSEYDKILTHFPPVEFSFAYGSGAVQQAGYNYENPAAELPMIDVIFVVKDPIQWHRENIVMNPEHYTTTFDVLWLAEFAQSADATGPALWFNVDIKMDSLGFPGRRMKYGLVSVGHILQDLRAWQSLYIAGRLHKPLHIIKPCEEIMRATRLNRMFALRTALLLLPPSFSEVQLFVTIAGLSYTGDQRMLMGAENLNKVDNIVLSKEDSFRNLYKSSLEGIGDSVGLKVWQDEHSDNHYSQDMSYLQTVNDEDHLPIHLRKILLQKLTTYGSRTDLVKTKASSSSSSILKQLSLISPVERSRVVNMAISHIVSRAAGRQTLVNLACVGVGKGASYLLAKVMKRITSKK